MAWRVERPRRIDSDLSKIFDSPRFFFGLALLLAVVAVVSQFQFGSPGKEVGGAEDIERLSQREDLNVVFVLVDALRADHLGTYGYERPTSPTIDAMTERGIRFANVEAQSSWTKASMASLWTGLFPQRSGILRYDDGLPSEAVLAAEIFQEAGYNTAGIFRNAWVGGNFGFDQGFDLYVGTSPSRTVNRLQASTMSTGGLRGSDIDATESAIEFMLSSVNDPFLLYVHYMDVHQYSYSTESDLFGSSFGDLYDNAIHWVDVNIARLLEAMSRMDLLGNTIVVIASDHGEGFGEHGFEGHAKGLYKEVQFTPWLIWLPFDLAESIVVDAQVANVDIWPTLLDLVGLDPLPAADGRSAVPAILAAARGESVPSEFAERIVYSQIDANWGRVRQSPYPMVAVLKPPYRFQHRTENPERDELFNHTDDATEQENVVLKEAETASILRDAAVDYLEEVTPDWDTNEIELDRMKLDQLRALGYKID